MAAARAAAKSPAVPYRSAGVVDRISHHAKALHLARRLAGLDRLRSRTVERRSARERLVGDAAKSEHVAAPVDVVDSGALFRAHVGGRADRETGGGERIASGGGDRRRDAEVGHDGFPAGEHDVGRLDVAVNHPRLVSVIQCSRDFTDDPSGFLQPELFLSIQGAAQRPLGQERHHVVQDAIRLAGIVQRDDVRMAQSGRKLDLA
jgi:hypothetical protein